MQDEFQRLSRRVLLGKMAITAGGLTLAGLVPTSLLQAAAPRACLQDAAACPDPCGDWQLDDVFTAYPPYSMHPERAAPAVSAAIQVDAIDRNWVS